MSQTLLSRCIICEQGTCFKYVQVRLYNLQASNSEQKTKFATQYTLCFASCFPTNELTLFHVQLCRTRQILPVKIYVKGWQSHFQQHLGRGSLTVYSHSLRFELAPTCFAQTKNKRRTPASQANKVLTWRFSAADASSLVEQSQGKIRIPSKQTPLDCKMEEFNPIR